jgi:hypothetical protein
MDTSLTAAAVFGVAAPTLYFAHHVGDYWVQTDHQAQHKGDPKREGKGRQACLAHVSTYVATQGVFLLLAILATGLEMSGPAILAALTVSGATHYWADRRWTLEWLAGLIPGKVNFFRLGAPRAGVRLEVWADCSTCEGRGTSTDESTGGRCWDCRGGGKLPGKPVGDLPSLGTGAWALDQSFHLALSVFVPALILAGAA